MSIPVAEAKEVTRETLQQQAIRIAEEFQISTTTFTNLLQSESGFDPDNYNKETGDRGIAQINERWHKEVSDECAYDPDCALAWSAQRIKDGYISEWVVCSCVATARLKVPNLPRGDAKTLIPNSSMQNAEIIILEYSGVRHLAVIEKIRNDGILVFEGNFKPCTINNRLIPWSEVEKNLIGFWKYEKET